MLAEDSNLQLVLPFAAHRADRAQPIFPMQSQALQVGSAWTTQGLSKPPGMLPDDALLNEPVPVVTDITQQSTVPCSLPLFVRHENQVSSRACKQASEGTCICAFQHKRFRWTCSRLAVCS